MIIVIQFILTDANAKPNFPNKDKLMKVRNCVTAEAVVHPHVT